MIISGLFLALPGEMFTEDMPLAAVTPKFPRASEHPAHALARQGVNATWVRLPRSVHGLGEPHGFIPMMESVAREKGFSACTGDGRNLWPSVYQFDAARISRLAPEHGAADGPFHKVAEAGISYRQIAQAISEGLGRPTQSISPKEAADQFALLAMYVAGNGPAFSERTRTRLGWVPEHPA